MEHESEEVQDSGVRREVDPDISTAREALVKDIFSRVDSTKKSRFAKQFKQMRADQDLTRYGYEKANWPKDSYVANITHRHVQNRVATLYAKNPKAIARPRERMIFQVWDENPDTISMAQDTLTQAMQQSGGNAIAGMAEDPAIQQAAAILEDFNTGRARKDMLAGVARTLELLFAYQLSEQTPGFKLQMKQLIRRTVINGVGYVKLGYHRAMEKTPETTSQIADISAQLATIEQIAADMQDGITSPDDKEAEELRIALARLQEEEEVVVREGLVFDFIKSTSVIIDPDCTLMTGFIGANWIAVEMFMSPEKVKKFYQVDVGQRFTHYNQNNTQTKSGNSHRDSKVKDKRTVRVIEYYDKPTGTMYTLAEGYPDFLEEPKAPSVKVERFFPIYALTFNEVEHENELIPPSDVSLIRDMQEEHNRSRQALREHRRASRPKFGVAGQLEDEDLEKLETHPAFAIIKFQSMLTGQKISDFIQAIPTIPIDQNLYSTNHIFEDMQLVSGSQEANFGSISGGTATETSIAEGSRTSAASSSIDDVDDFFTALARDAGQILLMEMDAVTVKRLIGPGAVWPELSRSEIASEIFLEIEAGSTGRPNKAMDLNNLQTVLPFLLQMPGITPRWLAETVLNRLDDNLDLTDAFTSGLPSIVSQNANQQPGTGDAASDPAAQGGQGANNAPVASGPQTAAPEAAFGSGDQAGGPLQRRPQS